MKEKSNTRKIVIFVLVAILLIIGIFGVCKLSEHLEDSKRKNKWRSYLCAYEIQIENQYETVNACFDALRNLSDIRNENHSAISRELSLTDEDEEELKKYNEEQFTELATVVLNNTSAELEFSDAEILKTFMDRGLSIGYIGEYYHKGEYSNAFSSFLTFFRDDDYGKIDNIKYKYDCIYYICDTLYPHTFTQGIIDTFLGVGVDSWGSSGSEMLEEAISYVTSSPEGVKPYESYIAIAKKQLEEKNAIEDSKPKNYCIECGSKASYSYESPFSGLKEWYCYSCYQDLKDLLDRFGMN